MVTYYLRDEVEHGVSDDFTTDQGKRTVAGRHTRTPRWSRLLLVAALLLGAAQACVGDIGDAPPAPVAEIQLEPASLARLTSAQYLNVVSDLFAGNLPTVTLQADTNPYLFYSIGATTTPLSELGVQQVEEAADAITLAVFGDSQRRAALVGCEPQTPGDSCVSSFIDDFGRRAFRRPLTATEHVRWLSVATKLADGDAWLGLRLAVAGMLQSPNMLYRVELGHPDPQAPGRLRFNGYEMASRLSFVLWNTAPDDTLLDAAAAGELDTREGVRTHARRLLEHPRARAAVQDFFGQYLDLQRLHGLTRDPASYPTFTPTMVASMRTEVRLLVDDFVYRRQADIREIFSTRRTFVNSDLAALYELDVEAASALAFVPVELPADGPRAGLLTLGAFLAMNAHETETSPTLRGKYVRERVLCQSVPAPPGNVNLDLSGTNGQPTSLRERLEEHRSNPQCYSCHQFTDPPGFLFENFDSVGAYRTTENGFAIDATGDLDGFKLNNARDLAARLRDDKRVGRCIVQQLYRHAQGRLNTQGEQSSLDQLHALFEASGFKFQQLLIELVSHDSFRYVAPQEAP